MKKGKNTVSSPPSVKKVKSEQKQSDSWKYIVLAGILILTLALYSNSLRNEILTFDDNEYFQNYPEILNLSPESVAKYFSGYYVIMYQPVPILTFALNYYFTGPEPFPLHLVNLLIHLANVILVFYFIRALVSNSTIAVLVALLFGIHPMNVEAISWISARSSSMYTFFYLLALISYLRYLKNEFLKHILFTALFFIAALFSKAQAVTLPVVMLLLDYYYNRNLKDRKIWLEKAPFFILSFVFGMITLADTDTMHNITEGMMVTYSPLNMVCMVAYSFVFYLIRLVAPVDLCAVYVYPPLTDGWLPWQYYFYTAVFAALVYLLFRFRSNKKVILGMGLFLITISINIQIIPSRLFIVTDRYAYFPYIGLYLLPLLLLDDWRKAKPFFYNKYQPYLLSLFFVVVVFFSVTVYQRNKIWQSDIPFMTDIIEKNPVVPYIYRAYGNRGNAYKRNGKLPEALQDFTSAIKIKPDDARNYYNRALVHWALNNTKSALNDLNEVISKDSMQWISYRERAQVRLLEKDTVGAMQDVEKLLSLDSTNADGYNVLANIAFGQSDFVKCEEVLTRAIQMNPTFTLGMKNRGLLYMRLNRRTEACSDFQQASNLGNQEAKQLFSQYCK